MPTLARAYLITFRTYGTWLHGDGRYSRHRRHANGYHTPVLAPAPAWREESRAAMGGDAVVLDAASRAIVHSTVHEVCAHRGRGLFAVNARTNHVHVVLSSSCRPEEAMATMKAWCTRRLREAKLLATDARLWAQHGSTRHLWSERDVEGAVRYVVEGQ